MRSRARIPSGARRESARPPIGVLRTIRVSAEFLDTFGRFSKSDQKRFLKALELLDSDERHPSLRVHQLGGDLSGFWSVSASDELRLLFVGGPDGTKILASCSRHYRS